MLCVIIKMQKAIGLSKRDSRYKEETKMALSNISGWNEQEVVNGSACGAGDKPAACGAGDKPAETPAACGAADRSEERRAGKGCGSRGAAYHEKGIAGLDLG